MRYGENPIRIWDPGSLSCDLIQNRVRPVLGEDARLWWIWGLGDPALPLRVGSDAQSICGFASLGLITDGGDDNFLPLGLRSDDGSCRATRVSTQICFTVLGLDLGGRIGAMTYGPACVWIRIWDPGELLESFWAPNLLVFGYLGGRLVSDLRIIVRRICLVSHTTRYIDGIFPSVRRMYLRGICMVGHTICYFVGARSVFGAIFDALLHPVTSCSALIMFNFDVVSTSIRCTLFQY